VYTGVGFLSTFTTSHASTALWQRASADAWAACRAFYTLPSWMRSASARSRRHSKPTYESRSVSVRLVLA
jgi:hypothetical protein